MRGGSASRAQIFRQLDRLTARRRTKIHGVAGVREERRHARLSRVAQRQPLDLSHRALSRRELQDSSNTRSVEFHRRAAGRFVGSQDAHLFQKGHCY